MMIWDKISYVDSNSTYSANLRMQNEKEKIAKIGKSNEEKLNFIFSLALVEIRINLEDAVFNMAEAYGRGNKEEIDRATDEYCKRNKLLDKALTHIEHGKHDWDWKWLADKGYLSEKDWEWFGKDLERAGVSKEEFDKKWK